MYIQSNLFFPLFIFFNSSLEVTCHTALISCVLCLQYVRYPMLTVRHP
jgi:hypothetical protein